MIDFSENAGDPPQKKIVKRSYLLLNLELGALLWAVGSPYIYLQTILATFGPKTIFQHNIYFREVKYTVVNEKEIIFDFTAHNTVGRLISNY